MEQINARCRKITENDLERLMKWRMMPEITKYMNTDPIITIEDQKRWFVRIQEDEKKTLEEGRNGFYWILEVDNIPAGFASLVNIEKEHRRIQTGLYIGEKSKRSLRLAIDIQWNLYDYAFDILDMNKVCEEVFDKNVAVNKILDICGSKREGFLRSHICKNGECYDVVTRGILKEEWLEKRKTLQYNKIEFD